MQYYTKKSLEISFWIWVIICLQLLPFPNAQASITPSDSLSNYSGHISWKTDLDETIGLARNSMRPVLVFFTTPNCLLCSHLKRFTLNSKKLQHILRNFERVEVDLSKRPELAMPFRVMNVPALYVIEPEGRIAGILEDYHTLEDVRTFLGSALAPYQPAKTITDNLAELMPGNATKEQWRQILLAMSDINVRKQVEKLVEKLSTRDRKILVSCLTDKMLGVRLGALELLEDLNDTIPGYDPWLSHQTGVQEKVLEHWQTWADSKTTIKTTTTTTLSEEQFKRYLQELIGEDSDRADNAMKRLIRSGKTAAAMIVDYLNHNPSINTYGARRIKEVLYAQAIPEIDMDPQAIAHRIIWGNQDVQLRAIRHLADYGTQPAAILVDLLSHEDSLVRETAVETLFAAVGSRAIPAVHDYLKHETDPDIIFTVLRQLGETESMKSQNILETFFKHENEDLVIVAVEGAVNVAVGPLGNKLLPLLEDSRWRVRVAALEAIKEKGGSDSGLIGLLKGQNSNLPNKIAKAVFKCLDDPDDFVRHTAAVTLGELNISKAEKPLKKAYAKYEDMHGVIVSVLIQLGISIPDNYIDDLFGPETDDLLFVLDNTKKISKISRSILYKSAKSEDLDISCSALRILANSKNRNGSDNKLLIQAIQSNSTEKQLTVIQEFDLNSEKSKKVRNDLKTIKPGSSAGNLLSQPGDTDILYAISELINEASTNEMVKSDGVILLCTFGHMGAFREAEKMWPELTSSMRATVAGSLSFYGKEAIPLFIKALNDDNDKVWKKSLNQLDGPGNHFFAEVITSYLLNPSSRLAASIIWPEGIKSICSTTPQLLKPFAQEVLKDPSAWQTDQIILALTIFTYTGYGENEQDKIVALCNHDNPFIRRASWLALVIKDRKKLENSFSKIKSDPSRYVRIIAPTLLTSSHSYLNSIDLYFSDEQVFTDYEGINIKTGQPVSYEDETSLSPGLIKQLKAMIEEEQNPLVRLRCMLCLLSYRIPYDLTKVVSTAKSSGEPEMVANLISDFFMSHGYYMGENFKVLLPLTHTPGDRYNSYKVESFLDRWGKSKKNTKVGLSFASQSQTPPVSDKPIMAEFIDPYSRDSESFNRSFKPFNYNTVSEADDSSSSSLVFFKAPGCKRCDLAEKQLQSLKKYFPKLTIFTHNIYTLEGLSLYEKLKKAFQLDAQEHLSSVPAVFMSSGSLLDREITFMSLNILIGRAFELDEDIDLNFNDGDSETSLPTDLIREQARSYSATNMAKAGFLKGIAPEPLVMLMFLLLYLVKAGQTGKAVLRYGMSYLGAVILFTLVFWTFPQSISSIPTSFKYLGDIFTALVILTIFVLCFKLFFRTIFSFMGKSKEKKEKKTFNPATKRVLSVTFFWGMIVVILNIITTNNIYTAVFFCLLKSNMMIMSSLGMILLYLTSFLLPQVSVVVLFSFLSIQYSQRSHPRIISVVTNIMLLIIWAFFLVKMIQFYL